jgi:ABC-type iron transport system FetAB ATPase subunit
MDKPEQIPAIEIDNLTLQFGSQTVLDDFSLSILPGQKVLLSGNSGTGKSSLLRCLLGFIVPRQGQIRIQGTPLDGKSVWHIRRQMAYVAQEPQLGSGKVRDVLGRPFTWKANHSLRYDADEMVQLCRRLYVPEMLLDKDITDLSGGEKQRIALISAILLGRSIYLLDETTSALDAESKKAILDYWASRTDLTVLIVSHDTAASSIADRVVTLPNGSAGGRHES